VDLPANNTSGANEKTNRKAIVYSTIENILANRERTVKGIINRQMLIKLFLFVNFPHLH